MRWILWVLLVVGCGEPAEDEMVAGPSVAEQLGLDTYLGVAEAEIESEDENSTVYGFAEDAGPLCLRGEPYRVSVRDTASEDLIIFLQGGGACWSEFCLAVTKARSGIPSVDILDDSLEVNPLSGWDIVYLPYCDGSFFAGDNDLDDDGDGTADRYHRGLHNLSAALTIAKDRFPAPRRIVLAGSSGGAYGTLLGTPLVRHVFPDAELYVIADSGMGLGRPGDDAYVETILDEFNLARFLPEDCPECLRNGHLTGLIGWFMARDEGVRVALFSSWYDSVLGDIFLDIEPASFRDAVASESGQLAEAYPDRLRRFVVDGRVHTALLGDATGVIGDDISAVEVPPDFINNLSSIELGGLESTAIDDTTFASWIGAMVDGESGWVDLAEEASDPPE